MKKLYLIGGTMGVGKTSTCQCLKKELPYSVFLDGDWCWDADPFQVTEETKHMVMENISFLLNNFLHCSAYENVIFCWVMHQQEIIDEIRNRLDLQDCKVKIVSLVCEEDVLRSRLKKDISQGIRREDVVERSVRRLPLYETLNTEKIDVSWISAAEAAKMIAGY